MLSSICHTALVGGTRPITIQWENGERNPSNRKGEGRYFFASNTFQIDNFYSFLVLEEVVNITTCIFALVNVQGTFIKKSVLV